MVGAARFERPTPCAQESSVASKGSISSPPFLAFPTTWGICIEAELDGDFVQLWITSTPTNALGADLIYAINTQESINVLIDANGLPSVQLVLGDTPGSYQVTVSVGANPGI